MDGRYVQQEKPPLMNRSSTAQTIVPNGYTTHAAPDGFNSHSIGQDRQDYAATYQGLPVRSYNAPSVHSTQNVQPETIPQGPYNAANYSQPMANRYSDQHATTNQNGRQPQVQHSGISMPYRSNEHRIPNNYNNVQPQPRQHGEPPFPSSYDNVQPIPRTRDDRPIANDRSDNQRPLEQYTNQQVPYRGLPPNNHSSPPPPTNYSGPIRTDHNGSTPANHNGLPPYKPSPLSGNARSTPPPPERRDPPPLANAYTPQPLKTQSHNEPRADHNPPLDRDTGPPPNRITIDHRTGRSGRTSLMHTFIKPFGARLIKPGKPRPAGSPELRADEKVYDTCNVRQRLVEGIRVYDMNPRATSTAEHFIPAAVFDIAPEMSAIQTTRTRESMHREDQERSHDEAQVRARDFATAPAAAPRSKGGAPAAPRRRRKQVYYFAGGGWQNPPSPEHWKLCAHLCATLHARGQPATVSLVSYPLAPNSPAVDAFPLLVPWYHEALAAPPTRAEQAELAELSRTPTNSSLGLGRVDTRASGSGSRRLLSRHVEEEEVIFAGDSAGANVALALTMHVLATDPEARAPSSLLLVSPAVDLRNSNPAMREVERKDPMLSVQFVNGTAAAWCGKGGDASDSRMSPLLGDVRVLAERGVVVNGVVGTYDVLAPDALLFREKCEKAGVKGKWLEWEKQMHAFPLAFAYKVVKEAAEAVEWMVNVLMDG